MELMVLYCVHKSQPFKLGVCQFISSQFTCNFHFNIIPICISMFQVKLCHTRGKKKRMKRHVSGGTLLTRKVKVQVKLQLSLCLTKHYAMKTSGELEA